MLCGQFGQRFVAGHDFVLFVRVHKVFDSWLLTVSIFTAGTLMYQWVLMALGPQVAVGGHVKFTFLANNSSKSQILGSNSSRNWGNPSPTKPFRGSRTSMRFEWCCWNVIPLWPMCVKVPVVLQVHGVSPCISGLLWWPWCTLTVEQR